MGKVKDEQLFTLLRDFLLVYLPNQRKASSNTVKAYRTTLNQFLKYTAEQKNISVLSVTSGMVTYEMVNSYLDWLSAGTTTTTRKTCGCSASVRMNCAVSIPYRSLNTQAAGRSPMSSAKPRRTVCLQGTAWHGRRWTKQSQNHSH